jgi:DNA-binding NtrC family response regulator
VSEGFCRQLAFAWSTESPFHSGILFAASRSFFPVDRDLVRMAANILVVEDDSSHRNLICKVLRQEGYDVVEASDGTQALKLFYAGRFDLVITDFSMPKLNGLKVVEQLHRLRPKLPIIFITGYRSIPSGKKILENATEILTKPFELDVLRSTVRRLLINSAVS